MPRLELVRSKPEKASLLARLNETVRSYWNRPLTMKDIDKWVGVGASTTAGIPISEETALTVSAVWSAVTMIADDIASLPWHLYKRTGNGGKELYDAHPLYSLVHDEPNPEMDPMVFYRTLQMHTLLWQNGYAEIERDRVGRPLAVWPLVPERVSPIRANGELLYRVTNVSGSHVDIPAGDMLHLVGPNSHDGTVGATLVAKARESIGLALAAERFGSSFFGNGATFGGVIASKGGKPPDKTDDGYRKQLEARHAGVERAHKLLLLYNDATFTPTGVEPDSAQFIETRTHQVREIARWFKIPPHKLGDLADATFSNVEQQNLDYYSSCLRPWLVLWRQQLTRKLVARLERRQQFIEADTHGFLAADAAGRAQLYTSEFGIGSVKPNEVRGYENRNPIAGGDEAFIQGAYMPLSLAKEWWQASLEEKKAQIAKLKEPPPPTNAAPPTDDQIASVRAAVSAEIASRDAALLDAFAKREAADEARRSADQRAEDLSDMGQVLVRERDEARALATELSTQVETLQADLGLVREQLVESTTLLAQEVVNFRTADARATDQEALKLAAVAETVSLRSQVEALATENAVQAQAISERDAAMMELRSARDASAASASEATAALIAAQAEREAAIQRAELAERATAVAEQAQAAANGALAETQARERKRMADMLPALRAIAVGIGRRMVRREVDRARQNARTAQKLRVWATTFYDEDRTVWVEAFEPVMRAHAAWLQLPDDSESLAKGVIDAQFAEACRQVADVVQSDDFHAAAERLFQRWETRRPDSLADGLMREQFLETRHES